MEYDLKQLESMIVRLNGKDYSNTWYAKHFRGMLTELYAIKKSAMNGDTGGLNGTILEKGK